MASCYWIPLLEGIVYGLGLLRIGLAERTGSWIDFFLQSFNTKDMLENTVFSIKCQSKLPRGYEMFEVSYVRKYFQYLGVL